MNMCIIFPRHATCNSFTHSEQKIDAYSQSKRWYKITWDFHKTFATTYSPLAYCWYLFSAWISSARHTTNDGWVIDWCREETRYFPWHAGAFFLLFFGCAIISTHTERTRRLLPILQIWNATRLEIEHDQDTTAGTTWKGLWPHSEFD